MHIHTLSVVEEKPLPRLFLWYRRVRRRQRIDVCDILEREVRTEMVMTAAICDMYGERHVRRGVCTCTYGEKG